MYLSSQTRELLEHFLRQSRSPKLITRENGEIDWVNESFEKLSGWTSAELVGKMTWVDMTVEGNELQADIQMVEQVVKGVRSRYDLKKQYKRNGRPPVWVVIDVVRFPPIGDFECFLVTVLPVEQELPMSLSLKHIERSLEQHRLLFLQVITSLSAISKANQDNVLSTEKISKCFERIAQWHKEHKFGVTLFWLFIVYLILQEDFAKFLGPIKQLLAPMPTE